MGDRGSAEYTLSHGHRLAAAVYQQVLVSPTLGGGERVAIAIHDRLSVARPGSSSLLAPASGGIARDMRDLGLAFETYDYQGLV
jgi:hypothetical protein